MRPSSLFHIRFVWKQGLNNVCFSWGEKVKVVCCISVSRLPIFCHRRSIILSKSLTWWCPAQPQQARLGKSQRPSVNCLKTTEATAVTCNARCHNNNDNKKTVADISVLLLANTTLPSSFAGHRVAHNPRREKSDSVKSPTLTICL